LLGHLNKIYVAVTKYWTDQCWCMVHRLCNVCTWYWCYLVSENLEFRV